MLTYTKGLVCMSYSYTVLYNKMSIYGMCKAYHEFDIDVLSLTFKA